MVFLEALKRKKTKIKNENNISSIFELKKSQLQTSELYKTIYFVNLKNRTISKILEVRQTVFNTQHTTKKRLSYLYYLSLNVHM